MQAVPNNNAGSAGSAGGSKNHAVPSSGFWKVGYFTENHEDTLDHFAISYVPAKGSRKASFSIPTANNGFTMANYEKAMGRFDFSNAYLNSLLVTSAVVLIAGFAAYGLVRCRFKLRRLCYSLIMAGMMFPVFSTMTMRTFTPKEGPNASSARRWIPPCGSA